MEVSDYSDHDVGVSVIIPTLGGDCLETTIDRLYQGRVVPSEILVCIPEDLAPRVQNLTSPNVRILSTPFRGQVAQRAYGFRHACYPLVLQLDDDVLLEPTAVDALVRALRQLGPGNAVAPIYRDPVTGRCLHSFHSGVVGWLQNLYAFLICDAPWGKNRMGVISPAGVAYGVDESLCNSELVEVEWQPGGCVLCHRHELVTEQFYPFVGKAFCEDLVHSLLRRERGIRLWIVPNAHCLTSATRVSDSLLSIGAEMKHRGYVLRLSGGMAWRFALWAVADTIKRAVVFCMSVLFYRR